MTPESGRDRLRSRADMWILLLAAVCAFTLRAMDLKKRPMHTDEAVHAVKFGELYDAGRYTYNPHEFHGPTLYYFTLPVVWLSGAENYAEMSGAAPLRVVPALFGAGLVLLPLLFRDGLGRRATVLAGLFAAVSPAFVFYGRYYIQETLFVFFAWAALGSLWRYLRSARLAWVLTAGVCVGLLQATKETSAVLYVAAFAAAGLVVTWARGVRPHPRLKIWHLAAATALSLAVAVACFTNFFRNPAAALDMVRAYSTYLDRAGTGDGHGTGQAAHVHPWFFYVERLLWFRNGPGPRWTEGAIVLMGALGAAAAVWPRLREGANPHLLRFIALFSLVLAVIFSVIPYKTPWNLLSFHYGLVLLAGTGGACLISRARPRLVRAAAGLILAGILTHLAVQSWRASFRFDADPRNPWVYGHTSPNLLRLVERIEELAPFHPRGREMPVFVVAPNDDYWPLPWYLRRYRNVGFWGDAPADLDAPVIINAPELGEKVESRLTGDYLQEFYGLRPDVLLSVRIEKSLWERFLATRAGAGD